MLCTPRGEFNALLEIFRRVFYSSFPISICGGLLLLEYYVEKISVVAASTQKTLKPSVFSNKIIIMSQVCKQTVSRVSTSLTFYICHILYIW